MNELSERSLSRGVLSRSTMRSRTPLDVRSNAMLKFHVEHETNINPARTYAKLMQKAKDYQERHKSVEPHRKRPERKMNVNFVVTHQTEEGILEPKKIPRLERPAQAMLRKLTQAKDVYIPPKFEMEFLRTYANERVKRVKRDFSKVKQRASDERAPNNRITSFIGQKDKVRLRTDRSITPTPSRSYLGASPTRSPPPESSMLDIADDKRSRMKLVKAALKNNDDIASNFESLIHKLRDYEDVQQICRLRDGVFMLSVFHEQQQQMLLSNLQSFSTRGYSVQNHPQLYYEQFNPCLLYTSPSPRDGLLSRMPSSA
eukprot:TRINITY_DN9339_c0_g1_i8.p1 TRINITY_DN9339_c0_g1~~TRINITY_DN9339_c0_g1_i8.p1  ORF type:complete len:315 (+),score=6.12 TRINITY_DN9339_c0_g1_i8:273-1217(+)